MMGDIQPVKPPAVILDSDTGALIKSEAPSRIIEEGPAPVRVPQVGDIVHYVLPLHSGCVSHAAGKHRPAIVVHKWGNEYSSALQLHVLLDGSNDFPYTHISAITGALWATSVAYSAEHTHGSWHWPERV